MTATLTLLRAPSANRVYAGQAGPLARAEARWVLGAHLGPDAAQVRSRQIAGIEHLVLAADAPEEDLLDLAATHSSAFAAFRLETDDPGDPAPLLRPLALPSALRHGSELETTLRYPGKTNEQFTAMLLNLAAALSDRRAGLMDGTLTVLDPLCGRGTTLNRALRLGLSPIGAEVDAKDVELYRAFLLGWAKEHRLVHTSSATRLTRDRRALGTRFDMELARDRAEQRAGRTQRVSVLGCDTTEIGPLVGRGAIDAIVADLPYGVQHGAKGEAAWRRSPLELLARTGEVWRPLLRAGGGMALALNRRTAPFEKTRAVLEDAGFAVLSRDGEFRHRVDQSIDRDVVLAVRTDHPRLDTLRALAAQVPPAPADGAAPDPRDSLPSTPSPERTQP